MSINAITIACVRGIRHPLSIRLEGRSLLLRGDNGSGKSSIAQALRWALTGSAAASADPENEYFRHKLEHTPDAARALITLMPQGSIERVGEGDRSDKQGTAFRDACVAAQPFLRRSELLSLLQDTPAARFKYFEGFLDLAPVDALCTALSARAKEKKLEKAELERRLDTQLGAARARLPVGSGPANATVESVTAAYFSWASRLGLILPIAATLDELLAACSRECDRARTPELRARRRKLALASERAATLAQPAHPAIVLQALGEAEASAREPELRAVLEQALDAIEAAPALVTCPVCEQPVHRTALADKLRARVAMLEEVTQREKEARQLALAWSTLFDELKHLEREASCIPEEPQPLPTGRRLLVNLAAQTDLAAETSLRIERLRAKLQEALAELPNDDQAVELNNLAEALRFASPALAELLQLEKDLARVSSIFEAISAIEKATSGARKEVARRILEGISSLVAKYYALVHPPDQEDEATGAPTIVVQRHGSGTARIRGMFDNEQVEAPQLVYSDGHLDSVGLCIFLALRRSRADRERTKDPKLMVLDDIVMSIDLGHAERFIQVLRDEFDDHQILIFSHNELFMTLCERNLPQALRMHINRWTLEDGPTLVDHVCDVTALRHCLEQTGSNTALASAMRPVLDSFLHEATHAFEVSVPAKKRLTVADQWGPLRKKLKALSKGGVIANVDAEISALGPLDLIRNALAAHQNDWAAEMPLRPVQEVVKALLSLIDKVACERCRAVARPKVHDDASAGRECNCAKGAAPLVPHPSSPKIPSLVASA